MSQKVREVFEQGQGIFRMMPNFVPRCFSACACTRTIILPWA